MVKVSNTTKPKELNLGDTSDRLIDHIIDLSMLYLIALVLSYILHSSLVLGQRNIFISLIYIVLIIGLTYLYYFLSEVLFSKTLGKAITKTHVVTATGDKPNIKTLAIRALCRFIPLDAFSFLASDPVGWHDNFSKTRVIRDTENSKKSKLIVIAAIFISSCIFILYSVVVITNTTNSLKLSLNTPNWQTVEIPQSTIHFESPKKGILFTHKTNPKLQDGETRYISMLKDRTYSVAVYPPVKSIDLTTNQKQSSWLKLIALFEVTNDKDTKPRQIYQKLTDEQNVAIYDTQYSFNKKAVTTLLSFHGIYNKNTGTTMFMTVTGPDSGSIIEQAQTQTQLGEQRLDDTELRFFNSIGN